MGYWLLKSARGKGVTRHVLEAISRFGLSQLERLELYVEPWNEASWRTAQSVSYQREGLLRQYQLVGHERKDIFMYSLLHSEL